MFACLQRSQSKIIQRGIVTDAPPKTVGAEVVTIDRSLKKPSGIVRVRNVLKRSERIVALKEQERWVEGTSTALGMPKVRVAQLVVGKKKKKVAEDEDGESTDEET